MLNSKNKIVHNQLMPISEKHHSSQSTRSTCKEVKKWVTNGTISFLIKPKNKEKKEPHISFYSKKSKFSFPFPWFSAAQKPKISNLNQKKKKKLELFQLLQSTEQNPDLEKERNAQIQAKINVSTLI